MKLFYIHFRALLFSKFLFMISNYIHQQSFTCVKWLESIPQNTIFSHLSFYYYIMIIVQTDSLGYTNSSGNRISILQKYFTIGEIEYSLFVQHCMYSKVFKYSAFACSYQYFHSHRLYHWWRNQSNRFSDLIHGLEVPILNWSSSINIYNIYIPVYWCAIAKAVATSQVNMRILFKFTLENQYKHDYDYDIKVGCVLNGKYLLLSAFCYNLKYFIRTVTPGYRICLGL